MKQKHLRDRWWWSFAAGAVVSFAPATSQATHPIDDLRASAEIYFDNGWGDQDGHRETVTNKTLPKAAGTLDLALDVRTLGFDHDAVINMTGTRHGSEVHWDFDEPMSGANIDDFNWIRRIEGHVVARVEPLSGSINPICGGVPCPYSLRLVEPGPGSYIRVHGTTSPFFEWTRDITVGFEMFSGWSRPALESLQFEAQELLCSREEDRTYAGRVTLSDASPGGGTDVELYSSDPDILPFHQVRVPAGSRSATFFVTVPGHYEGTVVMTAASAGLQYTHHLNVDAPLYCLPEHLTYYLTDPEAELNCRGCFDHLQLGRDGMAIATAQGGSDHMLRDTDGTWVDLEQYAGLPIDSALLSDMGDVAGVLGGGNGTAFYLGRADLEEPADLLKWFAPSGFDGKGTLFGAFGSPTKPHPAFFAGAQIKAIPYEPQLPVPEDPYVYPLLGGGQSYGYQYTLPAMPGPGTTLLGAASGGLAFGHYTGGGIVQPFVTTGAHHYAVADLGGTTAIADMNAAGDIAGTVFLYGKSVAFLQRAGGEPVYIKVPNGASAEAVAVDESGVVVVNLLSKGAGLYSIESGYIPLEEVLPAGPPDLEVDEVVHVNGNFDLSVRGGIDGWDAMFGLRAAAEEGAEQ